MKKLLVTAVAALLGLGSIAASAADLTPDERSELRQRADEWQRMRAQNPRAGQDGMRMDRPRGDVNMGKSRGDVKMGKSRGEVKARPKAGKKTKRARAKARIKRTAKEMPGALVRKDR